MYVIFIRVKNYVEIVRVRRKRAKRKEVGSAFDAHPAASSSRTVGYIFFFESRGKRTHRVLEATGRVR